MRSMKIVFLAMIIPFLLLANWEILDIPSNRDLWYVHALDEQTVFVYSDHSQGEDMYEGLWKTFDGTNWVLDSNLNAKFIYFVDDTLGFLRADLLTIDGGKTWQKGDTVNGKWITDISFPKGQSLIGYGLKIFWDTTVMKTIDGGWHWEELSTLPEVYPGFREQTAPIQICFPSDPDTGYITVWCKNYDEGEEHESYFKTCDGGQTWVLNEEGLWNDDFGSRWGIAFPENPSIGYMSGKKTYRTDDGGETWDTVYDYRGELCFPVNDKVGYVLGRKQIHRTIDGGETWDTFKVEEWEDTIFTYFYFLNNWVGYITCWSKYGTYYTPSFVIKTTDGLLGIAEEPPMTHPSDWQVITAIGQEIVLRYSNLPHGFHASVFDASGRKVDELHCNLTEGTVSWGKGRSTGVYFIRDVSGSMAIGKVILVE